jgi:hypothetical protein
VSYEVWERITGRPANTIASWSAGGAAYQIEVLLASLERLPAEERHRLIDAACREFPTLRHPKLAHDFVACSRLATLLRQVSGVTFIQGGPEHMRTFLLNALGHSAASMGFKDGSVMGMDIHRPDEFVPVFGVVYLDNVLRSEVIEREFNRLWPKILERASRLVLLNEVWRRVPAQQREILDLARKSHVVIADALPIKPGDWTIRGTGSMHLVIVSPVRERPELIRTDIQAL